MELKKRIEQAIKNKIEDAQVDIIDPDGKHLEAVVISKRFKALSLLQQHQLVMDSLKEELKTHLHSIKIKTLGG
jgi:stress-induced morphogen